MKLRNYLCLLVVLCLTLGAFALDASAAEVVQSGKCGDHLTWTLDSAGALTISGQGGMYNYGDALPWPAGDVQTVVIQTGVTSVGDYAFAYCTNLYSVTLPDSVTYIGDSAFYGCQGLIAVAMPAELYYLGEAAFCGCGNLSSVTIPDGLASIEDHTFSGCENLSSVAIPASVSHIGQWAFYGCSSLTAVALPGNVATIAPFTFAGCWSLESITIPKGVTAVGERAFDGCWSLGSLQFTGNAPAFGDDALADVTATVYYPADNTTWTAAVRQNYGGTITWVPCQTVKIITQPESVTVPRGATARVTLEARGDGLTYRWYYKNAGDEGFSLTTSFTGASYAVAMTDARNGREVYCVVTDRYGNEAVSDTVTLSMGAELKITAQPQTTYTRSGETARVTVRAEGDGLTYQWYLKRAGGTGYSRSSVTSATYATKMSGSSKDRYVYCVVTDAYGNSVKTEAVQLRMAATITAQPADAWAAGGETAKVTLKAVGDGLTYRWYYKNAGDAAFSLTNSFKSASYAVAMTNARNCRQVYCVVTDRYGNEAVSDTVTLFLGTELQITGQPRTAYAQLGRTARVTVQAQGEGLTYQWYIKSANGTRYSKSSVTSAAYAAKMSAGSKDRYVYCVITDRYGNSVKSDTVQLKMAATVTAQPQSVSVAEGAAASVTVSAVGDGLTYAWYFKDAGANRFSLTKTFTGSEYRVTMTEARNGRQIYCVITDRYGNTVTTDTVTLSMK